MTVTLSIWLLPIFATILIWVAAIIWPGEHSGGHDYGFGAALSALLRLAAAIIATLIAWLAFFGGMWWLG